MAAKIFGSAEILLINGVEWPHQIGHIERDDGVDMVFYKKDVATKDLQAGNEYEISSNYMKPVKFKLSFIERHSFVEDIMIYRYVFGNGEKSNAAFRHRISDLQKQINELWQRVK